MSGRPNFTINKITTPDIGYVEAVEAYARHGFHGITPWLDDVSEIGAMKSARIAHDAGLEITGFCNCGLFIQSGRDGSAAALERARRAIDVAAEIGSPSIVTVVGGLGEGDRDLASATNYAFDCLAETLEYAKSTPVTLALEPLHPLYTPDWSTVNTLRMANDWCERLGQGIGLTVDTYHVWWDHNAFVEIDRAGRAGRIVSFHISDWMVPTVDTLWDRGLPGEGVIDLSKFTRRVEAAGYRGPIEIEVFSNRHRARPTDQLLEDLSSRTVALSSSL